MKSLRFLFTLGILASLFFISCTKEAPVIIEEEKSADDSELISALYASDALIGKGEVKEDNKYSFTVRTDELSQDLRGQLDGKKNWVFENEVTISPEIMERVWGEKIKGTAIENGFDYEAKEYTVAKTYMTPEGESLTEQVENNPNILASSREIIDYIYIEMEVEVEVDPLGNVSVNISIYIESCTIVVP